MQIVIDIPEQRYIHLRKGGSIGASLMIENAIKNGKIIEKKYDCSCYRHYPNKPKCAEKYDCVRDLIEGKNWDFKTHCKKKVKAE